MLRQPRAARIRRPTSWVRVSIGIADHPDILALPSDSSRWAFVVLLAKAKVQPEPGSFRSLEHLKASLGWLLARQLPYLLGAGLVEVVTDGSSAGAARVHNWSRWQSAGSLDRTAAERQRRHREREKATRHGVTNGVTIADLSRVTNGDPPTGVSNASVTPPTEAVVTMLGEIEQRRVQAKAIREAPSRFRGKFLETFEREHGDHYPRPRATPIDKLHSLMRPVIRETWATFTDEQVPA